MNKKVLKIVIIVLVLIVILIGIIFGIKKLYYNYQVKHAIIEIELKDNLTAEFLSDIKVSDYIISINGNIIDDYKIDTKTLGKKVIKYEYINEDNIKIKQEYTIDIVDRTPPLVWLGSSYSTTVNSNINLTEKIMCGDNYDSNPKCEIIGDYDLTNAGTYPLVFKATDKSGNITEKNFNLYVKKPVSSGGASSGGTSTLPPGIPFSEAIKNYKTKDTEIGIDISEWQGDVDFNKLKEEGVEFVILRVGSTKGIDGDYFVDKRFKEYIEKANDADIPVGIYFYSYANSREKAIKDAKWVLNEIKGYKVDLPIAFDWENWSFYNEFNLSFFGLTDMANAFLDVFKKAGYEGMLYSSKTYLEEVWLKTDYPTWLAHYVDKTSYEGDYTYWQMCSDGRVNGIYGDVDIDIRYK